jgi:hypothetical protein
VVKDSHLTAYWFQFPGQPWLRHSYGVTAYSLDDARALLAKRGLVPAHVEPIEVRDRVRIQDLDQGHVVPNCGPLVFRGILYPCMNLGDEAP